MPSVSRERRALADATDKANQCLKSDLFDKSLPMSGSMALTEREKLGTILTGRKRPADDDHAAADMSNIDLDGAIIDANCDQVRRKIRRYLDSGEKVGDFCNAINVTNHSLNTFLSQHGAMKGAGSKTFPQAWEFFKKREMVGIKEPVAKKQRSSSAAKSSADSPAEKVDLSGIRLPEEEQGHRVAVYDTCDEVRKKINAHFTKTGVSQAQFCRDIAAQTDGRKVSTGQLNKFRDSKGPTIGNTSIVFYAAYVFFEKIRLKEDKKKSKHRLEMENIHPDGFDIDRLRDGSIWAPRDARVSMDGYGRISWHRR